MNDLDLRQDTLFMLILILVVGSAFAMLSSEPWQKREFIKDCSDTYTAEHCLELWEMGNG